MRIFPVLLLATLVFTGCGDPPGGSPTPDGGPAPDGALTPDAAIPPDARTAGDGGGIDITTLTPGRLQATITAAREVVREPAPGAEGDAVAQLYANTGADVVAWDWRVTHAETGAVVFTATVRDPQLTFLKGERGAYDVLLTVTDGQVYSQFFERRLLTVTLPRVPDGRTVHRVDLAVSSYFQGGEIDGVPVNPGDLVLVRGDIAKSWAFFNFQGTRDQPIHVLNEGVVTNRDTSWLLHLINCQHVIVDGLGDDSAEYGIQLANTTTDGGQAVFVRNYTQGDNVSTGSTGIEIFGVHIQQTPGTCVAVRTQGSAEYQRDNFVFEDFRLHHVLAENCGDEGFYLGYTRDWVGPDETHPAYKMHNSRIYRNQVRTTGWDAIQVCNSTDVELHHNHAEDAARDRVSSQQSNLQWNAGNSGFAYNNYFAGGAASDLQVGCSGGDSFFYANVFLQDEGIYLHSGAAEAPHYALFGNSVWLTQGTEAVVRLNHAPSASMDLCVGNGGLPLGQISVFNNLALPPAAQETFRLVTATSGALVQLTEPNLTVPAPDAGPLCVDPDTLALTCGTSTARSGAGLDFADAPVDAAALPGGVMTDHAGRVLAPFVHFGAYQ